jgi:hypothetical protein
VVEAPSSIEVSFDGLSVRLVGPLAARYVVEIVGGLRRC